MSFTGVGFDNYIKAITQNASFVTALTSGIGTFLLEIPAIVIFSLFVAIILNQKMAGRAAFRAIFFIPVILMTGLISSIDVSSNVAGSMESGSSIDMGTDQDNVSQIVDAMDIKALFSGMVIGTDMLDAITHARKQHLRYRKPLRRTDAYLPVRTSEYRSCDL